MANKFTMDTRTTVILGAAVACTVLPLEITHLLSAVLGIATYLVLQVIQGAPWRRAPRESKGGKHSKAWHPSSPTPRQWTPKSADRPPKARGSFGANAAEAAASRAGGAQARPEVRKPSAVPVLAPTFQSAGWEEEVKELVVQLVPTAESDEAVGRIAAAVKAGICQAIPEAEVSGFASGSLVSGKAFGVAVPEVDIVVTASPQALIGRLQGRWSNVCHQKLDVRKLHKSAIRACTDQLVSTGTFKFRRSAFRGDEPKVTMIAPASVTSSEQGIPIDLSVNAMTPVYNAALLAECDRMEPRAKELVLLVRRWAKDRGLCHTAKGHLPPYAWTLLSIFYLQASASEDGQQLLPRLEGSRVLSAGAVGRTGAPQAKEPPAPRTGGGPQLSVGELFRGFLRFYATEFNWRDEAVSVRVGQRGAPGIQLPLHVIVRDDGGATEVGPSIENPFEATTNVGSCMCLASMAHLHEELKRAEALCSRGGSLTELLTPWAPAEEEQQQS